MSRANFDNRQKGAPRCGHLRGLKLHLQTGLCLLVLSWSLSAHAHGPRPQVLELAVSYTPGGGVHALTNNQGVFADLNSTYRWVCEDAIYPLANTQGLALFGETDERWVVATNHGIHISLNSGCEFAPASGDVGVMRTAGLWRFSDTDLLMTGSMKLGEPNRLYKSADQGHTWDAGSEALEGQVLSVQWFSGEAPRMLVHTDRELYLAGHEGENASPVSIATEAIQIEGHLVRSVAIDPSENRRILIAVDGGARMRLLRSDDLGETWIDVAALDAEHVSLVFDPMGASALAISPDGRMWAGAAHEQAWRELPVGPRTLGCLRLGLSGELLACGNPNDGGDWVIGRSFDFGGTWEAVLHRFEDTVHRKDCPDTTRTVKCCRGRCPGDAMMCGQPTNPEWPPECYEVDQFQGLTDAGAPTGADFGLSDMGPVEDTDMTLSQDVDGSSGALQMDAGSPSIRTDAVPPGDGRAGRQSNGCQQSDSGQSILFGTFFLALLSIARRW